jgi:hypothetical protein
VFERHTDLRSVVTTALIRVGELLEELRADVKTVCGQSTYMRQFDVPAGLLIVGSSTQIGFD